jgi:uncharacterized protein
VPAPRLRVLRLSELPSSKPYDYLLLPIRGPIEASRIGSIAKFLRRVRFRESATLFVPMMLVPVSVGKSAIHGLGVFAISPIRKGAVLWQFEGGLDRQISDYSVNYGEKRVADFIRERGYINPVNPKLWIVPVDAAQWWNFPRRGEPANTELGGMVDGEYLILAAKDIEPGEELTIPPESDLDYYRKMQGRP